LISLVTIPVNRLPEVQLRDPSWCKIWSEVFGALAERLDEPGEPLGLVQRQEVAAVSDRLGLGSRNGINCALPLIGA
jgi:hypothetical protein